MLQSTACLVADGATNAFKNGFGLAGIARCILLYAEEMGKKLPSSVQLLSNTTRAV